MSYFANPLADYSPQLEAGGSAPRMTGSERSTSSVFGEDEEVELASEFLEIASERDLDHFIGELTDRASSVMDSDLDGPVERDLGGIFKGIAKAVLPLAGGALGFFVGGPPGAALGSGLASSVGHALGLELEGLSPEDSEFAVAKQFVRFAGAAVKKAHDAGLTGDPAKQAREAAMEAARIHAPGLIDIHDEAFVDRPAERTDGSAAPTLSRPKGARTMSNFDRGQPGSSRGYADNTNTRRGRGLSEEEQMDLATELMELETEEEFENFLGDLISKGAQAVGKLISSPTGQALGGVLKDAAKTLLPVAGTALGTYFGGPVGAQIGGALGSAASNAFEAEAEAEEREWEAANVFVRVAVDAINNAADAPPDADPHDVSRHAVIDAMRRHAPHAAGALFNGHGAAQHRRHRHHSGNWVRHGRTIVVHGI
jgi:uncharacterized protein (DUF697 family)